MKRDNFYLEEIMYNLWENHFVDVPRKNKVIIKFGKKSARQLGSIKWARNNTRGIRKLINKSAINKEDDNRLTIITITKYFIDDFVPDIIVKATIAHEMCHYAHGFNSPIQQIYAHPHKGGIVRKEMKDRGLGDLYKQANKWLKLNWENYIRKMRT